VRSRKTVGEVERMHNNNKPEENENG